MPAAFYLVEIKMTDSRVHIDVLVEETIALTKSIPSNHPRRPPASNRPSIGQSSRRASRARFELQGPPGPLHAGTERLRNVPNQKDDKAIVTGLIDESTPHGWNDIRQQRASHRHGRRRFYFDIKGHKLYDLKGTNLYKLSGELVGHIPLDARSSERPLDKSADKLFR
jgi:hypothetical protein